MLTLEKHVDAKEFVALPLLEICLFMLFNLTYLHKTVIVSMLQCSMFYVSMFYCCLPDNIISPLVLVIFDCLLLSYSNFYNSIYFWLLNFI